MCFFRSLFDIDFSFIFGFVIFQCFIKFLLLSLTLKRSQVSVVHLNVKFSKFLKLFQIKFVLGRQPPHYGVVDRIPRFCRVFVCVVANSFAVVVVCRVEHV